MNNSMRQSSDRGSEGGSNPNPDLGLDEDWPLVELARNGDLRAFDELVTRHRERIFAMIKHMIREEAEAWDLSQEVFVKAWNALPRFESKAKFSTWLYRIAHNAVYDWTRKRKVTGGAEWSEEIFERERIDSDSRTTPSGGESPARSLERMELRNKIEAAMSKLSIDHREAVLLRDVQGLSYQEVADATGATIGTVMSRLFYARQKLQSLLKNEYENR